MLLLAAALTFPGVASAGPWTPKARAGYAKLWARYLLGMGVSNGAGEHVDGPGYHEVTFSAYTELGLTGSLALQVNWPLVQMFVLEDPRTAVSSTHIHPGDPTLGLKWMFLKRGSFAASADVSVRFPVAPDGDMAPVYSPEPPHANMGGLQVGAGVWDFHLGGSVGYAWSAKYLAASVGYIIRTHGYDHDLAWTAEYGMTFWNALSARLRLTGRHPLPVGDEDVPRHESPSGIGNGTSYVGLGLEAEYWFLSWWALGISFEGGLFAVQRQSGGPVLSLYAAWRY